MKLAATILVSTMLVSGCEVLTGLDGSSTKTFVNMDAACRSYGFALSSASKVIELMDEEQIEYVESTREAVNPICTSPNPPSNNMATVQSAVGGLLAIAISHGVEPVSEEVL